MGSKGFMVPMRAKVYLPHMPPLHSFLGIQCLTVFFPFSMPPPPPSSPSSPCCSAYLLSFISGCVCLEKTSLNPPPSHITAHGGITRHQSPHPPHSLPPSLPPSDPLARLMYLTSLGSHPIHDSVVNHGPSSYTSPLSFFTFSQVN